MTRAKLGIIGGSGLYDLPGLENKCEKKITSAWGEPSDVLRFGTIGQTDIVFLPRHGRGHVYAPSDINYRANIDVMKQVGVTDILSISACGSFKEDLPPGSFVLVDQFIDRTIKRETSFFGKGCVAHISMAHPIGPAFADLIAQAAARVDISVSRGGTYICMEGPQFSTWQELMSYKSSGCSVIGMTAMPEAKLAREAEITYATLAMVTDFDCWHPEHDAVDIQSILQIMHANSDKAKILVKSLAEIYPFDRILCPVGSHKALDNAVITAKDARDPALVEKLTYVMKRISSADLK